MSDAEEQTDVFELRPLLYPALPNDSDINPTSPAALARSLRCAEPYGAYIYLGSTDGKVFCYVQPSALDDDVEDDYRAGPSQDFRHIDTRSISSKPVERIVILSGLAVAAVLSEATVTFYELPSFLPIPQQVLPHIKGVTAIALDDKESVSGTKSSGVDAEGLAGLCIIRRKMIMLVKLSKDTWRVVKEIPLTGGATSARRFGDWLCISTFSEYNVVNLKDATLSVVGLPISQTTDSPSASSRPSIASIHDGGKDSERCEFLITSHSEELTLGVFIGQEGEPTAKLLEWPSHPRAIALQYPYVHSLLRNDTIQVHDLTSMQLVQTVHLPSLLEPRTLSNGTSFLQLVEEKENWGMSLVEVQLNSMGRRTRLDDQTTSSWRFKALRHRRVRSDVLMIGKNAVQGMFRSNVLNSAIRAAHRGDFKRAVRLANATWQQRATFAADSLQALELEYINQLIAVESARLLDFDAALRFSTRGSLDHRLWLSLFPALMKGIQQDSGDAIEVSSKVADILDDIGNLETFPRDNVVLNYCPPLDATTNATLRKLQAGLQSKIQKFIERLVGCCTADQEIMERQSSRRQLETVQARLLIMKGDANAVSAFLDKAKECDVEVLEHELEQVGCHAVLARLYRERKDFAKSLDMETRLFDKQLQDDWYTGSTQDIADLLNVCDDPELVHRYSIWLVQRDATAGVKALLKGRSATATNVAGLGEERSTLKELQKIDEKAALAYLEAIALTRKHQDADTHRELAQVLLDRVRSALTSDRAATEAITSDYVQGAYAESFVAHLTLHIESSSVAAIDRLKLMALMQGSTVLDTDAMLVEIEKEPLLSYEKAILYGKQANDKAALDLLAVQLHDANSAETYCSQDRRPLSLPVLQGVETGDLKVYCALVSRSLKRSQGVNDKKANQLDLLNTLLRVYMQASRSDEFQVATTHLLNTQALHLNAKEILATVPPHWSVRTLETFLSRSIRRETHRANEGQIQRAAALAQNLETAEMLWSKRRGLGGVIEDGTEDSGNGQDDLGRALLEKVKQSEKYDDHAAADTQHAVIVDQKEA